MNKLTIIGNLTRDPELRTVSSGISVCDFTVAVSRKKGSDKTDFFRVTVWRQLGEICAKYLAKGRKVCVVGPVSVRTYQTQQGETRAQLEVTADDIEFLSPRDQAEEQYQAQERKAIKHETQFTPVDDDDIPF